MVSALAFHDTLSVDTVKKANALAGAIKKDVEGSPSAPDSVEATASEDTENNRIIIKCLTKKNGLTKETVIDKALLSSNEFVELSAVAKGLLSAGTPPFAIRDENTEAGAGSYIELMERILEYGKKGLTIQRYKGLGEMNPDQLWETTMDPEKRILSRVKIEDAVEADEIFSKLMGDSVEPRRNFIEKHALDVSNLDV